MLRASLCGFISNATVSLPGLQRENELAARLSAFTYFLTETATRIRRDFRLRKGLDGGQDTEASSPASGSTWLGSGPRHHGASASGGSSGSYTDDTGDRV